MSSTTLPAIAIFGATGGSAGSLLVQSIKAGYTCRALVRTPEKLTTFLETENITPSQISSQLTMITGDVRSEPDVAKVLFPDDTNVPVDMIVSGIGAYPEIKWWGGIGSKDPKLCAEGISVILSLLSSRTQGLKKPLVVTIGTTGISKLGRDNPWLMVPLYKGLLGEAHRDKERMEESVVKAFEAQKIGGYTIVHASALTSGKMLGVESVRSEVEGREWSGKAIGYTISRKDVGNWIFEDVVKGYESVKGKGRIARITY